MVSDISTMSPIERFERQSNEMMFFIGIIFVLVAAVKIGFWFYMRHKERRLNEVKQPAIDAEETWKAEKQAAMVEALAILEKKQRILADNKAVLAMMEDQAKVDSLSKSNDGLKQLLKEAEAEKKELLKRLERLEEAVSRNG